MKAIHIVHSVNIIILLGFIYLFTNMPKFAGPPDAPADRNKVLWNRGRVMYTTRCTSCHNSNPDLQGSVGPALRGVTEDLLTDRIMNGKGAMPAQPRMKRFIPAIREYLR